MTDPQTDALLHRIAARDPAAFTEFVRAHEQMMLRTAFRIVGQMADALEVRQNVLTRIWRQSEKIPHRAASLEAWIRRSVINESISLLRTANRRMQREHKSSKSEAAESEADRDCESTALRVALQQLSADERALLSLRFDDMLTIREIAKTLEKPHTTIQSQLQRTIDKLRSRLSVPMSQHLAEDQP